MIQLSFSFYDCKYTINNLNLQIFFCFYHQYSLQYTQLIFANSETKIIFLEIGQYFGSL